MTTVWFTADHHFGHAKIIEYCNRPFADVAEMNAAMIEAWNSKVQPGDVVWHLGDFACGLPMAEGHAIFENLNGTKHLIVGNHEHIGSRLPWASQRTYADITIDRQRIVMSHYALRSWIASRHGTLMLYGHSHGQLPSARTSLDVGVDVWDFAPVKLQEIRERMAKSPILNFDGIEATEGPGSAP